MSFLNIIYLSSVNIGIGKVGMDKIGASFIPVKSIIDVGMAFGYFFFHSSYA